VLVTRVVVPTAALVKVVLVGLLPLRLILGQSLHVVAVAPQPVSQLLSDPANGHDGVVPGVRLGPARLHLRREAKDLEADLEVRDGKVHELCCELVGQESVEGLQTPLVRELPAALVLALPAVKGARVRRLMHRLRHGGTVGRGRRRSEQQAVSPYATVAGNMTGGGGGLQRRGSGVEELE
jgi:hypothetical protein